MKQSYEVYKVFSDAGISGKDIAHRTAIQELLKEAAEKKFDIVMSWKINRLSRKLEDAIKIVNTLDRYGISYRSYSEPFESDTPAGKMQFQMMALRALKNIWFFIFNDKRYKKSTSLRLSSGGFSKFWMIFDTVYMLNLIIFLPSALQFFLDLLQI